MSVERDKNGEDVRQDRQKIQPPPRGPEEDLSSYCERLVACAEAEKDRRMPKKDRDETLDEYKQRIHAEKAIDQIFEEAKMKELKIFQSKTTKELKIFQSKTRVLEEELKQFPTWEEIAKGNIHIVNETDSSAHTNTGHPKATHTPMEMPKVEIPEYFWEHRPKFRFPKRINGEPGLNSKLSILVEELIYGIRLGDHISPMLDVPVIDKAADVMLTTENNKRMIGAMEGKKQSRTEKERQKIFGSGTEVAGENFEQLTLVNLNNDTFAVGIISTLQSFQLTCTEDISNWPPLTVDAAKNYFEAKKDGSADLTPNKPKVVKDSGNACKKQKVLPKANVELTAAPPKEDGKPKKGRVQLHIEEEEIERKFYATKPISFSSVEAENRKVLELLLSFVLLCVESLKRAPKTPLDLSAPGSRCSARQVKLKGNSFAFKQIQFPCGMQFDAKPNRSHTVLFSLRQLGYGLSGSC